VDRPPISLRLRIITGRGDGCYVDVDERPDGKLLVRLISPWHGKPEERNPKHLESDLETVDDAIIDKADLASWIDSVHDY